MCFGIWGVQHVGHVFLRKNYQEVLYLTFMLCPYLWWVGFHLLSVQFRIFSSSWSLHIAFGFFLQILWQLFFFSNPLCLPAFPIILVSSLGVHRVVVTVSVFVPHAKLLVCCLYVYLILSSLSSVTCQFVIPRSGIVGCL